MCIDQQIKQTPGPSLSEYICALLTFVFEFELCILRAPQGLAPVQATKKSESKMTIKKLYLSTVITFHTFNRHHHVVPPLVQCMTIKMKAERKKDLEGSSSKTEA